MPKHQNEKQGTMQTGASKTQQKAICHTIGPARVLAGPGSGKTFTIIQRLQYLVNTMSVSPDKILCITFTKAAALEMQERYLKQYHETRLAYGKVCFSTIHSICFHMLKESGEFRQYSLIKESQKRKLMEMQLKEVYHTNSYLNEKYSLSELVNYSMISEILDAVGKEKNGLIYESDELPRSCFKQIFTKYQDALQERKLLDFDDMTGCALKLLLQNITIREKWQRQFEHILVDEFQDVNDVQYQLIKLLALPQNNLFVVGDDDQAIYGFRGALPNIMKQFSKDYPDANLLFLTENYRSRENIVRFANQVISENTERIEKKADSKKKDGTVCISCKESYTEEAECLLQDIYKLSQKELYQSAVIVRTNREAEHYAKLLRNHHIPVRESQKTSPSVNRPIVQSFIKEDFCAFLQFCMEGEKRSDFLKIMNKPERYLSRYALKGETVSETDFLEYYRNNPSMIENVKNFFTHIRRVKEMSFSMAIRYYRNIMKYDDYLREKAANKEERFEYLKTADELLLLLKKHKNGEDSMTFWSRIEEEMCTVNSQKTNSTTNREGISVLTMHSAKGLEFFHVFLPDVNEGIIPPKQCKTKEGLEEERRLLYVAITRAVDYLTIYYTKERGQNSSRFIRRFIPRQ